MNEEKPNVGVTEYVIFILILVISVLVGVYHGYKYKFKQLYEHVFKINNQVDNLEMEDKENEETSKINSDVIVPTENSKLAEYHTASSSLGILPVSFSLLVSIFSTNSVIGIPADVYQYGVQILIIGFGHGIAPIFSALVFAPFFDKLGILSMFEYIEMRYNSRKVRLMAMGFYVVRNLISSAIYVLGPSSALSLLLKLDTTTSIVIVCSIGTLYTCIGGIKAVIWTDLFQAIIMFFSLFVMCVRGVSDAGGLQNLLEINRQGGRLNLFDFNPDPFIRQSFWNLMIGGWMNFMVFYCFDQQMLQRFKATRTKKQAKISILLNAPGCVLVVSLCSFCGLIVYANYATCDPLIAKQITNPNQYISHYIFSKFHSVPGMIGIFLGAVFCSSLSSLSSCLNSLAAIIWKDFLQIFSYFRQCSDSHSLTINKIIVLISGFIILILTYFFSLLTSNLVQTANKFNGVINGPIVGLFLLSTLFTCVNVHGASLGFIFGLGMNLWLTVGSLVLNPVYPRLDLSVRSCFNQSSMANLTSPEISYTHLESNLVGFDRFYALGYNYYTTFGAINTMIAGLLISIATGGLKNKVEKHLVVCDLF